LVFASLLFCGRADKTLTQGGAFANSATLRPFANAYYYFIGWFMIADNEF
jgi:hypothetical protein